MRRAFDAAVGLLTMPYLQLQEDNRSLKLVGSEQPFVGVLSGILPYHQNCIVDDKGKFVEVKQSSESGSNTDGSELRFTHKTQDSSKLMCENDAVTVDEIDLCKTQVFALTYSLDVSELVKQFRALAHRIKCICRSSAEIPSGCDIIEMALVDIQMQKMRLSTCLNGIAFQCELSVDGVSIAHGEGDSKKEAKQAAYNAAVELLSQPYLMLKENSQLMRSYSVVGSDEPFDAESCCAFSYKKKLVTAESHDQDKQASVCEHAVIHVASHANDNELLQQQHPTHSLTDFVILQDHFKKKSKASVQILHESAAFNKWSLSYDLSTVDGGCRCCLKLGRHTLSDVVGGSKSLAKKAAAEKAFKQLTSICYTLQVKEVDVTANALTRDEVYIHVHSWSYLSIVYTM